jgi:RNA polymerase primary sigma factor
MDRYLEEIGRYPLLDREEEARLARRARERGDGAARRQLVTANLRFVVAVAKRYRGRGVAFEELVNEGNVGLVRAAERFDERHGVRFVTYAAWWVRQAILAALSAARPEAPAARKRNGRRAGVVRESGSGRRRAARVRFVSLDHPGPGRRDGALEERVPDAGAADPGSSVERQALRDLLDAGLAFLPEREERVLRGYFGLDGRPARSLERLGRELGVSGERVRQLKDRALDRLRAAPHREALEDFAR